MYGGYGDGNTSESIKGISDFNLWNEVSMVVSVIAKNRMEWFRVITWFEVKVMYINHQSVSLDHGWSHLLRLDVIQIIQFWDISF